MGGSSANKTLPRIEFSEENLERGSSWWVPTSKAVVGALEEFGCFIANHTTFSPQLHHAIFGAAEELFHLPTHVKMLNTSLTPSHGYVGQEAVIPLYEGLGIENATTQQGVHRFTALLWPPSGNHTFGETALEFSKAVAELDEVVMRMVSDVYGITNSYETLHDSTSYLLRLIKYRPPATHETNVGIIPHTDKSFMSYIHQHHVKGLEIKTKDGDWITVDPSPSEFIVFAGDAVMGWSNGRIEPPYHRVVIDGSEERFSAGVFTFIKDMKIQVPEELVDEDHPLQFKAFHNYDYIHFTYTQEGRAAKSPIRAYCGV